MVIARDILIETESGYCSYDIDEMEGACIYNLYVYKDFRRCGKARELLSLAIEEIRSNGYGCQIGIEASPKENSISKESLVDFYRSLGLYVTNAEDGVKDGTLR
jgi:ribosomal protein S18 acetylase RimI-like enzyme